MSGLPLRFDGMPAGGVCQEHGAYESTWERTWFGMANGVLACVCPTCEAENPQTATITIPDQSIPRTLPRVSSSAKLGRDLLRFQVPRIASDALDLACLKSAGTRPLSELRGEAFAASALSLAEMTSEEIGDALYSLYKTIPEPLMRDKVNLRLRLAEGMALPVQEIIARPGLPKWITAFGISLLAWHDTFEIED
jgi:hypothetical protein